MAAFDCKCRKHARCARCMENNGGLSQTPGNAARQIHIMPDRANRDPRFFASVVKKVRR